MFLKYKFEDLEKEDLIPFNIELSFDPKIDITPELFCEKCKEILAPFPSKRNHAEILKKYCRYAKFTEDPSYSQQFLQNEIHSFLIFKLNEELNDELIPIDQDFHLKYIELLLLIIQVYSYSSIDIMVELMNNNLFPCLLAHVQFLTGKKCEEYSKLVCGSIYIIFVIILNYFSEIKIKEYNVDFDDLLQICIDQLFNSDDIDIEIIIIQLFSTFLKRFDIINDDIRKVIFEQFDKILEIWHTSLFNEILFTLSSFASLEPGMHFIIEDETQLAERFSLIGLEHDNEFIEYNSLLLANLLYNNLTDERLNNFHSKFPLKRYQTFLQESRTQKAALNVIFTIVSNYPDFIDSLYLNNIYSTLDGSLYFIFDKCQFELKEIAADIVLRTLLWNNNKDLTMTIFENKLIILSLCIINANPSADSCAPNSIVPLAADALLLLVQNEFFKDTLIEQIFENDLYDTIAEYQCENDEINQKFDILRGILFEDETI